MATSRTLRRKDENGGLLTVCCSCYCRQVTLTTSVFTIHDVQVCNTIIISLFKNILSINIAESIKQNLTCNECETGTRWSRPTDDLTYGCGSLPRAHATRGSKKEGLKKEGTYTYTSKIYEKEHNHNMAHVPCTKLQTGLRGSFIFILGNGQSPSVVFI
jgi:hypothetical protein